MVQPKSDIMACILASGKDAGLDGGRTISDQEETLRDLLKTRQVLEAGLLNINKELSSREDYLRALNVNYAVSKQDVPRLRAELGVLKSKIDTLTFATERWNTLLGKQEQQIDSLEETAQRLTAATALEQEELCSLEKEILGAEQDLQSFDEAREKFTTILREHGFDQWDPAVCEALAKEDSGLGIPEIASAINGSAAAINEERSRIVAAKAGQVSLTAALAHLAERISEARGQLDNRDQELASLRAEVAEQTRENKLQLEKIRTLKEQYQTYEKIFLESAETRGRYDDLVNQANEACAALKDSLVANSRFELSLRLEDLKAKFLVDEFTKIGF